ncbi:Argininosuccinate lyase [Sphingobium herbicidovorans NBRC 16415]|jgi:hypothetical protein|uniref:Argininosuccinate lyase n=1 Tax=Sphingobium herbicidovorans (strain ATCC 700291 / DSM 11019 / CCUG 56400 / KCTC 2939 / LMG 18315 / NBRC 16415 / MH) TaxID=1219045 RepID=A0A086PB59_SPHHM|nr:hypothetical protein [Sphingobium herbicidovorans]KFG90627.1 Argininosuccinate lyase [Sphingobium herbicidovorans NBRC 16415]
MRITLGRGLALGAIALALASCGGRQPLKPVEGQKMPAVPVGAAAAPTAQQLMTPSIQARPERNVELLTQSQERRDDPFDLPPERQPQ